MILYKKCMICNGQFTTNNPNQVYCSPKCRHRAKVKSNKKYKKREKSVNITEILNDETEPFVNSSKIDENCRMAKLNNMTYGEYMARKEGRL